MILKKTRVEKFLSAWLCLILCTSVGCSSGSENSGSTSDSKDHTVAQSVFIDPDDPNWPGSEDNDSDGGIEEPGGTDGSDGSIEEPGEGDDDSASNADDLNRKCGDHLLEDIILNFQEVGCPGRKKASLEFTGGPQSLSNLIQYGLEVKALEDTRIQMIFAKLGQEGNIVVFADSRWSPLRVPSGQSSGLKIKVRPSAYLKKGQTYILKLKLKNSCRIRWHENKGRCQMTPPVLEVAEIRLK